MMKNKNNFLVTLGLLSVALIWGSGFIATQIAIDEGLSSTFIMFIRFTMATIMMGVFVRKDLKEIKAKDIKGGVIVGIFLFLAFILQTIGLQFTTPAVNAFITATCVVMVPFFSWIIFKEKPANKAFIAALICFGGIGILAASGGGSLVPSKGDTITLMGAIAFAFHTVSLGVFARKINSRVLTFLQIATAAVLSLIVFIVADRDLSAFASTKGLLAVLYLAIFSTCIAYFIQTLCQQYASPSKTSIIISTESLFGTTLSVLLGFELFTYNLIIGGLAIFLSVIIIETNIFSKNKLEAN